MELCTVCLSQLHIGVREQGDFWITIEDFEKGIQKSPRLIKASEWRLAVRVIGIEFRQNHDQKLFWRRLWEISENKEWPDFYAWLFAQYNNPTLNDESSLAEHGMVLKWSWKPKTGTFEHYEVQSSPKTLVTQEVALRLIEEGGKDRPFSYVDAIKKAVAEYRKDGNTSKFWLAVLSWLKTPEVIKKLLDSLIPTKKVDSTYCIEVPEVFPTKERRDTSPKPTKRPSPKPAVFPPAPAKTAAPTYPKMTRRRFKEVWDSYQRITVEKRLAMEVYTYWHDFTLGKNLDLILPDSFWKTLWSMMGPTEMGLFLELAGF